MVTRDKIRDDFAAPDDYSCEQCLKTSEDYDSARNAIEYFFDTLGEPTPEVFDAPDTLLAGLPNSSKVKLRRSIVAQLKAETFGGTDHVDD